MKQYQERVKVEHKALQEKIKKLEAFILYGEFGVLKVKEQQLLLRQLVPMTEYSDILSLRIQGF